MRHNGNYFLQTSDKTTIPRIKRVLSRNLAPKPKEGMNSILEEWIIRDLERQEVWEDDLIVGALVFSNLLYNNKLRLDVIIKHIRTSINNRRTPAKLNQGYNSDPSALEGNQISTQEQRMIFTPPQRFQELLILEFTYSIKGAIA